jgi:hypothetical protein
MISAFHLPALANVPTTTWSYGSGAASVQLRIPRLTPELLQAQTEALVEARTRFLEPRRVAEVVQIIDGVAARLADPADPLREAAVAALPAITGYSPPMVDRILEAMAADWRGSRLHELLRAEFGDPGVLDGFCARAGSGTRSRAFGPRLATHIFSGNVPGVAVTSLVRSLLVKAGTLGKTAAGEPLLPALFARGIHEADPELGACIAVTYWPGGNEELEQIALRAAEAVIVYGSDEVVASVRARTPPTVRWLGYGHKLSFGVIGRERLRTAGAGELARRAAVEVATFDQQGCVSPHLFYVEEGGETSPQEWARQLAAAMAALERTLPRGTLSPRESAAIRQVRGEAEFAQLAGSGVELCASEEGTVWTVIFDPDPVFAASCLNRVVRVKPIARLEDVPALIGSLGAYLQTVGVAADGERTRSLAEVLGRLGASRIASLGEMSWPPPSWHHDGRPPLADLVRWCDLEEL